AEDLQRMGLDHPSDELTASAEGVPPLTVRLGKENSFDGSVYLQREGDPRVYAVQATTRATLDRSTFDLRDRDVIAVRDLGVTGIEVTGRKGDWAVAREPEHPYAFVRPVKDEADTTAISSWLGTLRGTKATRYLQDSPAERQRTGVEKPLVEATFRRGKTETVHVRLAAGKGEADPAHVLREDQFGTSLAEVPRTAIAALDKGPAELRDRTVLHVKAEDVVRMRLGAGPTALVVERERPTDGGLETWRLRVPAEAPVDPFKASSLLYGLTSLKAEPTDQSLPNDPKRTGLGPGARTLTVEGKDGKVLGAIAVGGTWTKPAGTFVRDDRGRVVLVDPARLKELPGTAADLLPAPPPPAPPARPAADAGS
ncbi:MAG TPA: DUF4340 domain-containing protein, partial [Myxococcaceae bacterium]|nr:DUF4340 domain-containing protein [Myxococcaceae bacterium]